jgi:hypothetical protein
MSLVLGDVLLSGDWSPANYTISALADDATWGNPQPVEVAVQTLLQNSSAVVTERYDNREVSIRVQVEAEDSQTLAAGEAALFAELGKRNTLTWTPPDGYGPPTVFRVVTSSMDHEFDDLGELYTKRVYGLRLVCEAFGRSVDETVVEALSSTSGGTPLDILIDDGTSLTGWSATSAGTSVIVESGAVHTTPWVDYPAMKRTGAIDMTDTPLLVADIKTNGEYVPLAVFNGSINATPVADTGSQFSGYKRYFYESPVTSITSVEFKRPKSGSTGGRPVIVTSSRIFVTELRRQNTPPASGTLHQKAFTADVSGSAPNDGAIEVYATDGLALGLTIAYTYPSDGQGFSPALRPSLDSATNLAQSSTSAVSGARNDITGTATVRYALPADQVASGTYEVGAFLRSSVTGAKTLTVTAETYSGGDSQTFTPSVTFATANAWQYAVLGRVRLPLNRVNPGTPLTVRLTIGQATGSGTVDIDEAYLFNLEAGALTVADCGTFTHLWLTPATMDYPSPSVMFGTADDGSDALAAGSRVKAAGVHKVSPGSMNAFIVTHDSLDPGVRLRFTAAWHTHAAA